MPHGKFEKVSKTDTPMYGPRKLLLCGFDAKTQVKFKTVLDMAGLSDLPLIWANVDHSDILMSQLLDMPHDTGFEVTSGLPRAIIVSGVTEKEFYRLMTICKKTGMKRSIWAALTPTSETWTLNTLLTELQEERKALSQR